MLTAIRNERYSDGQWDKTISRGFAAVPLSPEMCLDEQF